MKLAVLIDDLKHDLYRYNGQTGLMAFVKGVIMHKGLFLTLSYRMGQYVQALPIGPVSVLMQIYYRLVQMVFAVEVPLKTRIGPGFYFVHLIGTVLHEKVVIGKNVHIAHNVTIGATHRGVPVVGDNVAIMPGAKIFGKVRIGNNVVVGSNAVVTKDVEDNAIVAGIPARVLSYEGSSRHTSKALSSQSESNEPEVLLDVRTGVQNICMLSITGD
jgi:serine O-acetyltransferase